MTPIYDSAWSAACAFAAGKPDEEAMLCAGSDKYIHDLIDRGELVPVAHPRGWAPRQWALPNHNGGRARKGTRGWYVLNLDGSVREGPAKSKALAFAIVNRLTEDDPQLTRKRVRAGQYDIMRGDEHVFRIARHDTIGDRNGQEEAMKATTKKATAKKAVTKKATAKKQATKKADTVIVPKDERVKATQDEVVEFIKKLMPDAPSRHRTLIMLRESGKKCNPVRFRAAYEEIVLGVKPSTNGAKPKAKANGKKAAVKAPAAKKANGKKASAKTDDPYKPIPKPTAKKRTRKTTAKKAVKA